MVHGFDDFPVKTAHIADEACTEQRIHHGIGIIQKDLRRFHGIDDFHRKVQ